MAVRPIEFPPPFDSADVIGPPTDPEDERIEVGIAIVGGGPAGLACANKLMQLLEDEPELTEKLGEVPVAVIEKGKVPGAHLLSGANVDPSALTRLFPDNRWSRRSRRGCRRRPLRLCRRGSGPVWRPTSCRSPLCGSWAAAASAESPSSW